jgi:DNA-binding response OmpR family regulator
MRNGTNVHHSGASASDSHRLPFAEKRATAFPGGQVTAAREVAAQPTGSFRGFKRARLELTVSAIHNCPPMANDLKILVIDDEEDLVELVSFNLKRESFDVVCARDGQSGLRSAQHDRPDLIVLDVMMPQLDGLEVCRQLRADRRTRDVPIIMLTAKATESDRVVGLELGADDYVTKPFSPRELVARVKAVLRRSAGAPEPAKILRRGPLLIDLERHEVSFDGRAVALTATEFRILELLTSRAGRVFSRESLINGAMGAHAAVFDRTIDVHITALRRKLGANGSALIQTVRGFGYRLADRAPDELIAQ